MIRGILSAAFALLVWGVTFANTRALLFNFSALEIMVVWFAMAWVALWGMDASGRRRGRSPRPTGMTRFARGASPTGGNGDAVETTASTGSEWLFVGMGMTGVFVYQFLENCAIYYTNASNVAILVSFGPIVTAAIRTNVYERPVTLARCCWRFIDCGVRRCAGESEWRSQFQYATIG